MHRIKNTITSSFAWSLAFVLCSTLPPATAEIPCPPDAPTEAKFYKSALAFYLKTSVDVYKSSATTQPVDDHEVVRFMTGIEQNLVALAQAPTMESLVNQGHRLVKRGCNDPLVLYFLGLALNRTNHPNQAEPFLCQAADSILLDKYPANWRARAAEDAFMVLKADGKGGRAPKYRDQLVAAVAEIFKEHVFGDDRALLMRNLYVLTDDLPSLALHKIVTAAKSVPDADPVAVLYLEGQWHIQAAWQDRGGDWADKVTAKGWNGFADELAKARTALVQAWTLDPRIAEPATAMIHVSMGESNPDEMRTWFNRAVAARFDDTDAYEAYIWGIYPRWLGDRSTLMSFADECAATARYDTQVPLDYFKILIVVRQECDDNRNKALVIPDIYTKAHDILEKTLAPDGAQPNNRQLRSAEVAYAVAAKQWKDARQAIDMLKGAKLDAGATKEWGLTPEKIEAAIQEHPGDQN